MAEGGRPPWFWALSIGLVVSLLGMAIGAGRMMGYTGQHAPPPSPLVGTSASSFSLPLVAGDGAGGERVDLEALRGEVVLLDFWASWCRPCRQSIPILNQVHERYGERVHFYGVNIEEGMAASRIQSAHRSFGAAFPSLRDEGYAAQGAYEVQHIPTVVVIGREGDIRFVESGVPSEDRLTAALDAALQR